MPFVFALHPALIFKGAASEIILAVVASSVGTFLLAIGCAGYLSRPMNWLTRGLFCLAGLLLMLPTWHGAWLILDAGGLLLGIAMFVRERRADPAIRPARAKIVEP